MSTHRDHRRRGFASALCDAVAKNAESQGRPVGLLFSAVPPGIYENLGFHVTPGVMSKCTQLEALAKSGPKAKPVPIDPRRAMDRLEDWYSNFHGQALHLYRDEAGWHRNLECNPSDLFFALGDNGYVRLWDSGSLLEVCELVVPENEIAPVLRWAADIAHQLGRDGLTGWWRPPTELRTLVDDLGRAKTLPMVRGDVPSEGFHAWSSDYF